MYTIIMCFVFFASVAMTVREGLWSNIIRLVSIVISGLLAFGFYPAVATWLDEALNGEFTYVADFLSIWGLFVVSLLVISIITGAASKTRLRFKYPIDTVGGPLVGVIIAFVMVGIVGATLHTSPMPHDAFGGGLMVDNSTVQTTSSITSPLFFWLRLAEGCGSEDTLGVADSSYSPLTTEDFVVNFKIRRYQFEKAGQMRVAR